MTITTNTTDRKALVKAIAEELGTTSTYLRAPTYGYQIGDFTVDRDGNIIGEDFTALQDFLRRNGYVNDEPAADQEAVTEAQPDEEVHADSKAEPITQMDISIPARNAAVAQLKNLIFMLHSRQTLINRMTDSDCLNIPDILIDRLQESTPETLEDLTSLLDDSRAVAELTGFDFRDGKVSMTFPFNLRQPAESDLRRGDEGHTGIPGPGGTGRPEREVPRARLAPAAGIPRRGFQSRAENPAGPPERLLCLRKRRQDAGPQGKVHRHPAGAQAGRAGSGGAGGHG